jgi:MFS family permease
MTPAKRRSVGWIVASLCMGTALSALNSGMIAVSLSTLRTEFALDVPTVTWVISVFYLASAVLQPIMGRLADHYGAHRVFTVGTVIVAAAGILGAVAPTFVWVCVARVVLAVGTAATFPAAAAILRRLAATPEVDAASRIDAAKLIARIQLVDTSTAALGPVLGGVLITLFGWEAVFWINVPLAAIAFVSTFVVVPKDEPRARARLRTVVIESDVPGILAFAVTVVAALMFLLDITDGPDWYLLLIAIAAGAAFAWRELHCASPFIDLRMLRANGPLLRVYAIIILGSLVLYSVLFGLPQYLEDYAKFSTAAVGALLVPLALFNVLLARPVEKLIDARGLRAVLLIGSTGLLVATLALALLGIAAPAWAVVLITAAIGIPYVLVLIAVTQSLYKDAPPDRVGQAAGLFQTARSLGCIGAGAVVGLSFSGGTDPDDWVVLSIAIVVIALALVAVIALTGRVRRSRMAVPPATAE